MINDSVREELKPKIAPLAKPFAAERRENLFVPNKSPNPPAQMKINSPFAAPVPKPSVGRTIEKTVTNEIAVKQTMPTLIEFQSPNATLPDWRLQLQNAVKKRQSQEAFQTSNQAVKTSGANALKLQPQIEIEPIPEPEIISHANPRVNSALQRIANSRRQFLLAEEVEIAPAATAETVPPAKQYPYRIAAREGEILPEAKTATVNYTVKPRTSISPKTETKEFDTNKLPTLPAQISAAFDIHKTASDEEERNVQKTELKLVATEEIIEDTEIEIEEIEDIAPFSMRFNAGLFDLIIGAFASLILFAPFMLKGGNIFSFSGILGFLAICAVVVFVYMTVAVGLYGRTLGMRLFSLEVVDIEGENYPTIHQAAVSASLYLLSLAFGGAGFLTLPFNDEKRAVHDLASGTIVVKEM